MAGRRNGETFTHAVMLSSRADNRLREVAGLLHMPVERVIRRAIKRYAKLVLAEEGAKHARRLRAQRKAIQEARIEP